MWAFDQILDLSVAASGRFLARVQVARGDEVRTLFFQFAEAPSDEAVAAAASGYLAHMNAEANPQPE